MTKNSNALDESYTQSARDRFLEITNKKKLADEEIWILIQAIAQYVGVVQAHKTLRGIIAHPNSQHNAEYFEEERTLSSFASALAYAGQIMDALEEEQDPIIIESQVLNNSKRKGTSTYKLMIGDLEKGLSEAIKYRTAGFRDPKDFILEVNANRTGLPEGLDVLVYEHSLEYYGGRIHSERLLQAKIVARYERGIITRDTVATVIEIQKAVGDGSYLDKALDFCGSSSTPKDRHGKVIGGLMIDLKANPEAPQKIINLLTDDEAGRFMYNGGAFRRNLGAGPESYIIDAADIQRPGR